MAVVIETTIGDFTVDLFLTERPKACLNFLKLCKLKYYNFSLFHTIEHGFIAQTGDPTGSGDGGESIWGVLEGKSKRFFKAECQPKIRHSEVGLLSMVSFGENLIGSQFFVTLGTDLTSLDGKHCVIGQVTEGLDILRHLNEAICDSTHRPFQDIRITHTVILDDPFTNPKWFKAPSRSPSPSAERLQGGRIGADEDIDDHEGKTEQEIQEMFQEREAKARATILEIVGDLPDAEVAPPENVLFVCKLNPVTSDDDLEIIFSRFGKVKGCEVIRDRTTGDSLQYAFVEFEDSKACENAYFKMDNVLIDDRRIHVDFSQSVAKVQWKGKGRGLIWKDENQSNWLNFNDLKGKNQSDRNQCESNRRDKRDQLNCHARSPSRRKRLGTPNTHRSQHRRDTETGSSRNERGRYLASESRSRNKKEEMKRQSSRSKSHEKYELVKRPISRDKKERVEYMASLSKSRNQNERHSYRTGSRDGNQRPKHLRSRSISTDRTYRLRLNFGSGTQHCNRQYNQYKINQKDSSNNQQKGCDPIEVTHPRTVMPKQKSKDRLAIKARKSESSDSDSTPMRKKYKKTNNKRKHRKTDKKKSKKVSSTESSCSPSSSSSSSS